MYADVFEHPLPQLASSWLIWSDTTPVDITVQWREDLASVVNSTTVTDPTIQQPAFDFTCHTWSLLNRFWKGQDPCPANLHKSSLAKSLTCNCGQWQIMKHTVDATQVHWQIATTSRSWRWCSQLAGIISE